MVKFALDVDVIKTKIVSFSKETVSCGFDHIARSFQFSEYEQPLARPSGCGKLLPVFLLFFLRITLKRP